MEKFKIEIKWALLASIAYMLWIYLEKLLGWHNQKIKFQPIFTMLFGFVTLLIYILALKEKKESYFNNTINWKQGFLSGAILSLFIALFTPVVTYLSFEYISPTFFSNFINYKVTQTKMSIADAQKYFSLSNYIYTSTFSSLSNGIVIGAVVSYFIKNKEQ